MKRTLTIAAVLGTVMLMVSSCSKKADLTEYIPQSTVMAMTLDAEDIIVNTGSEITDKGIELSPKLSGLMRTFMGSKAETMEELLSLNCIDYSQATMFMTMGSSVSAEPTAFFNIRLTDKDDFIKAMTDEMDLEAEEGDDGFTRLMKGDTERFCIKDNVLWGCSGPRGYKDVRDIIDEAKDKPLAEWKRDLLDEENTLNLLLDPSSLSPAVRQMILSNVGAQGGNVKKLLDKTFGLQAKLDGLKLTATFRMYGKDGATVNASDLGMPMTLEAIDTSLLSYFTPNDITVFAMGLKGGTDWNTLLSEQMRDMMGSYEMQEMAPYLQQVAQFLSYIDGTIMIGGGVNTGNLMELANAQTDFSTFDIGVVMQLRQGAKDEIMAQLDSSLTQFAGPEMAAAGINYETTPEGRIFTLPQGKIYVSGKGNTLYLGLHPATGGGGCPIRASELQGEYSAWAVNMPKSSVLAKGFGLPFGVDLLIASDLKEGKLKLELTDCQGKYLLEEILNATI